MKKLIILSSLMLSACIGLYDRPVYFKDGKQVYQAICNGAARDIGDCYTLASERCAGSFDIVDEKTEVVGTSKQVYRDSDYDRDSNRENTRSGDKTFGNTYSNGNLRTSGSELKLNITNRSVYFVCK